VAAFCACCGAEITLKTEACPLCGAPQHGMLQPDLLPTFAVITEPSQDEAELVWTEKADARVGQISHPLVQSY
jgi:predicted amidophosphoribosyltransferase